MAIRDSDFWSGEIWDRRKNGEIYASRTSISSVRSKTGLLQHYVAVFSDVSKFKAHEAELERAAHYDPLTGAPNRRMLADRLTMRSSTARAPTAHWPCVLWTWTTSRPSTTCMAMRQETRCWWR
jgi:hypothetical protein